MRELKFRAWSKERNVYFYSDDGRGFTFHVSPVGGCFIENSCANGHKSIETEPWEQFTGLKDKDGRDIYEGDILNVQDPTDKNPKTRKGVFLVDVTFGHWGIETDWVHVSGYSCSTHIMGDADENGLMPNVEIIGNIHQHPSLAGEGEGV